MMIKLDHNRFCATPFGGWGRTTGLSEQEQTLCSRLAFPGGSGDALIGCAVKASNGVQNCTKTGPIGSGLGFWTEAQALKGAMDYKNDAAAELAARVQGQAAAAQAVQTQQLQAPPPLAPEGWAAELAAERAHAAELAARVQAQAVQAQQMQRLLSLYSTNKVQTGDFLCRTISGVEHTSGVTTPIPGGEWGIQVDGMTTYVCAPPALVDIELASARGQDVQPLQPGASCTPMSNRHFDIHICAPTFLEAVNRKTDMETLATQHSVISMREEISKLSSTVHALQQTMNGGAMGPA